MDSIEFLKHCLEIGKITQERHDKGVAKMQKKASAKVKYKADKAKLSKAEMQTLLDTFTAD